MLKPQACYNPDPTPCPLAAYTRKDGVTVELGTSFSVPDGKGTLGVVLIGEGLGHEEAVDGLPFRPKAQAGSKLEDTFRRLGVKRDQFFIWNILGCQPPGNLLEDMWYANGAIEHCMKTHFDRVVQGFHTPHIKTLVALGNTALRVLTGVSGDASSKESISHLRGYVFPSKWGWVVPAYHPSYLRRGNPQLTPTLVEDLRKAVAIAQGKYWDFRGNSHWEKPTYITTPSLDDAWSYYYRALENEKLVISYDIETSSSPEVEEDEREEIAHEPIESIQFSLAAGEGIYLPYKDEYITIAHKMMLLPNRKIGWNNWFFDDPIMKNAGFKFGGGLPIDLMWMFKHWHPRLERALQKAASLFNFPFPWKHLYGTNMGLYGCADVDAPQRILPKLVAAMKGIANPENGVTVWDGFVEQIYQVHPCLTRASDRGIPVSEVRHAQLGKDLGEKLKELYGELQVLVPDELKNVTPKRKVN